ncbi:hypothetical protein, partial [Streptomyces sp. NPDC127574]|uniref:hypothetical protein n=1 Tax=Streptomyces sp. NPDC127574 TaxID=3345401 RepID=UPI003631BE82
MIYEINLKTGTLSSFKDNTSTGGSLLTPLRTYDNVWATKKRVWSTGTRIRALASDGCVTSTTSDNDAAGGPHTGFPALAATNAGAKILAAADDVWMQGNKIYALKGGAIQTLAYAETA